MTEVIFNKDKAISAMSYICNVLGGSWDKYSLLKILYFAEQSHLAKYARPITWDKIVALEYGPVPSNSYDIIKNSVNNPVYFEVKDTVVISKFESNMEVLSLSDIECLDESILENRHASFGDLRDKSHDSAYDFTIENFGLNEVIPLDKIAKAGGADESIYGFIQDNIDSIKAELDEQCF